MLIILGPPGSGKGTQARRVSKLLNGQYVSAGDSLKDQLKNDEDLMAAIHRGKVVEDERVNAFLTQLLHSLKRGDIFEGFPRTIKQCDYFLKHLHPNTVEGVVILQVSQETLFQRLCKRHVCFTCHTPYDEMNVCCNVVTAVRMDDKDIEAINMRWNIFNNNIMEIERKLVEHKMKLIHINGEMAKDRITQDIVTFYNQLIMGK